MPTEKIVVIDESTSELNDPTRYGRSEGGSRAVGRRSFGKRTSVAIIGAICLAGVLGMMYGEWTTTGCIFEEFLRSHICPEVNADDVVILDNAAIHKGKAVREMVDACGARLLYLPPYSPDFSPIELMWLKIKAFLRRRKTDNMGEFHDALSSALNELESEDFSGWFSHCGYSV